MMETTLIEFDEDFIKPTVFCDSQSELIRRAARNIIHNSDSTRERAIKVYYWVRDNIKYELGLSRDAASGTLVKGGGSCTNKSNLTVALLRSLGIPAGFHVMEVYTKKYLGAFCTPRFNQFMSEKSYHIYCSVKVGDSWIKIDPSDDARLSNAIQHITFQATKLYFDGETDTLPHLDPDHIISDPGTLLLSVDPILEKTRRIPMAAVSIMNLYLDFLRHNGIWNNHVETIEAEFFSWLEREQPTLFATYQALARKVSYVNSNEPDGNPGIGIIRNNSVSGQA